MRALVSQLADRLQKRIARPAVGGQGVGKDPNLEFVRDRALQRFEAEGTRNALVSCERHAALRPGTCPARRRGRERDGAKDPEMNRLGRRVGRGRSGGGARLSLASRDETLQVGAVAHHAGAQELFGERADVVPRNGRWTWRRCDERCRVGRSGGG